MSRAPLDSDRRLPRKPHRSEGLGVDPARAALLLLAVAAVLLAPRLAAGEEPWFVDVAAERGLVFEHQDARFGAKYYVETAASGGGFLDVDGDGDLDIYLINGAPTPGSPVARTGPNRLFENRAGHFVDITEAAGVGDTSYGMGLCVGDIDGDGRLDFLVTNHGPDRLYRNLGDGRLGADRTPADSATVRFEEIGEKAGVADPRWSVGCAFGDVDGDGDLDLYVARYVDFRYEANPFCGDRARDLRAYCRPQAFAGVDDSLYLNRGDGTFEEVTGERGIVVGGGDEKGFGVVMSDLDDDGDLDIYVANDGTMNRLYVNDGRGHFTEEALLAGVGLDVRGFAQSGMGVAVDDVLGGPDGRGDGRMDLLVTNYSLETNTLYANRGGLLFDDVSVASGLMEPSYPYVGWGVVFFDFDLDGDLDIAIANGHAVDNIEIFEAGLAYAQPNLLLRNDGRGQFVAVGAEAGAAFQQARVSRGLAVGDIDDDGRLDLLVTNTNGAVELLHNRWAGEQRWLGIRLEGPPGNRFAIGARLVLRAGNREQTREVRSGGSFLVQHDLRLHFGLGGLEDDRAVEVEIRWPDGRRQVESTRSLDRYWTIAYRPSRGAGSPRGGDAGRGVD